MAKRRAGRAFVFGMVALAVVGLDFASKRWAEGALLRAPSEIIDGALRFVLAKNPGGMWSILRDTHAGIRLPIFLGVTLLAIAAMGHFWRQLERAETTLRLALALVLGGAIGNLMDRLRYGYVIDFIDVHAKGVHWPTFNVADIAITIGVALIALRGVAWKRRLTPEEVTSPPSPSPPSPS